MACPWRSSPQQVTEPYRSTAHECSSPVAIPGSAMYSAVTDTVPVLASPSLSVAVTEQVQTSSSPVCSPSTISSVSVLVVVSVKLTPSTSQAKP